MLVLRRKEEGGGGGSGVEWEVGGVGEKRIVGDGLTTSQNSEDACLCI